MKSITHRKIFSQISICKEVHIGEAIFFLCFVFILCVSNFSRGAVSSVKNFFADKKSAYPPLGGGFAVLSRTYSSLRWERGRQGAPCPEGDLIISALPLQL